MTDTPRNTPDKLTITEYRRLTTGDEYFRSGDWREHARCVELVEKRPDKFTPEMWFPVPVGRGKSKPATVPPKIRSVCLACDVRLYCLTYAIQTQPPDGIWAGHLAKTIRKMRRRLRAAL